MDWNLAKWWKVESYSEIKNDEKKNMCVERSQRCILIPGLKYTLDLTENLFIWLTVYTEMKKNEGVSKVKY